MSYTLHEEYNSKNFTPGKDADAVWHAGPRVVKGITIHHWGSKGQDFWTVNNYLCVNNKPTSAHYVAQAGLVSCIVSPDDAAWHAGHPVGNTTTIGIECRPEATAGDYQTVAELVAFLRKIYGNVPLYPHNHWQATECPGVYDLARINDLAAKVAAPAPVKPAKPLPVPAPVPVKPTPRYERDPHWVMERGETLGMAAAHFGVSVARLAAYNGIANPDVVPVGLIVWPPVGRGVWIVDPGDTLTSIARHYGTSAQSIAYANGINDPAKLIVGTRLQIP